MSRTHSFWSLGLAIAALSACTEPGPDDLDGGFLDGGGNRPPCAVDQQNSPEAAMALTVGMPFQGMAAICPITDRDWYRFDVPTGFPLVTLDVGYPSGATTGVEFAYDLFTSPPDPNQPLVGVQDDVPQDNRSTLHRTHYLTAGTYYMRVRDVGDNEQDVLNTYGITINAAADNDPNEPNDRCADATPIATGASGTGALTFPGDKDSFAVTLPAGAQVIDFIATTSVASAVDLKISLFDVNDGPFLSAVVDARGEDGPTDLRLRYGVQSPGGTYCVTIEDDDGADSDPESQFTVTYQLVPEPDTNEAAQRNDVPDSATNLGSGGNRTGYIASLNDLDWYRITATPGQIMEINVSCPGCTIQPAISIMYAATESPCDATSTCDFILRAQQCTTDNDCDSKVCRETPSGKRCAVTCEGDIDCPSLTCNQIGVVNACVASAAAVCMTGQCGILQYTYDSETDSITTAQPVINAVTYLLVHDSRDDQYTQQPYTLNVSVVNDPDRNEPNNRYVPYRNIDAGEILDAGRMSATRVSWAGGAVSGTGCISYQGDIDIFRLVGGNPCRTSTAAPSAACGLQLTYNRPGGPVDHAYFLANGGLGTRASFLQSSEGNETVFGDAVCNPGGGDQECMVYFAGDQEDYFLIVRDFRGNMEDPFQWSTNAANCYSWTLRAAAAGGCPASCPTVVNNLCNCQ